VQCPTLSGVELSFNILLQVDETRTFSDEDKSKFYLQMDIKKFFYSIDQQILIKILSDKYFKDKQLVKLIEIFVLNGSENKIGIPIGNLLSQIFANVYMNEVDQFIKSKYDYSYVRYMDDFVLIGIPSYSECIRIKQDTEKFIADKLNLKLSKFKISKIESGINYAGYRIKQDSIILRARQYTNFIIHNKNIEVLNALFSMAKHTTSFKHFLKHFEIQRENEKYGKEIL
jgi:hypothetical protein